MARTLRYFIYISHTQHLLKKNNKSDGVRQVNDINMFNFTNQIQRSIGDVWRVSAAGRATLLLLHCGLKRLWCAEQRPLWPRRARALTLKPTQQWRLPVPTATRRAPTTAVFYGLLHITFTSRRRVAACKVSDSGLHDTSIRFQLKTSSCVRLVVCSFPETKIC